MMYNNMWYGFGGLGWLFMLLWWALPILGIVALVRYLGDNGTRRQSSALEILKERYAKGEIDEKEFKEKKRHLL